MTSAGKMPAPRTTKFKGLSKVYLSNLKSKMARFSPHPQYSDRYDRAVQFALEAHRYQQRKYSGKPYILHLQAVSSYVWLDDGNENEAIAAWLHDYPEDIAPERGMTIPEGVEAIAREFGPEIAAIVRGCTECDRSGTWRDRKQLYIDQVAASSDSVVLVSLADKYDNYSNGYFHEIGQKSAQPSRKRPEIIWFGETLAEIYRRRLPHSLLVPQFFQVLEYLKPFHLE